VAEMSWPEKMAASLTHFTGKEKMQLIMEGCEGLDRLDEKAKAEKVKIMMDKIDEQITDDETKIQIMTECSCRCYEDFIHEFKEEYEKNNDLDRLLDLMHGNVFLVKPVRDGNTVYITKAPRFPEQHSKARTPEEKRYYFCHCDYVRALTGEISSTYCYCGAGWCQQIWESVLDKPVRVEITKSVLQGDEVCQFAVHL